MITQNPNLPELQNPSLHVPSSSSVFDPPMPGRLTPTPADLLTHSDRIFAVGACLASYGPKTTCLFVRLSFYGSYFDYISAWNKKVSDENVLVVIYEELKKNMSEEIKKIAKFLNFTLTDEQIQSICSMSTFKSMKENSMNTHGEMGNILFRKGDIGDWKNCLTEEQSKAVDDKFEKHLAGTKIGDLLKYDEYCK
ncbi:sulfotransferase 6B1-like [Erpetoichthys calabaricus]|uniref:sulfotransferase 6B1-like n=1 Tax=Erpetoichthys calabaricus TaxID=27687 RepID=UPI002234540D|nr:sulfotransferase 6B1-like [Erpetoichthys calabaricus]